MSDAIEDVLGSEREAQAAVAACEQEGLAILETARQRARGIVERGQARTVALHGRAAKKLESCAAALMDERMKAAGEAVKLLAETSRFNSALGRVAAQLTTDSVSPDVA